MATKVTKWLPGDGVALSLSFYPCNSKALRTVSNSMQALTVKYQIRATLGEGGFGRVYLAL